MNLLEYDLIGVVHSPFKEPQESDTGDLRYEKEISWLLGAIGFLGILGSITGIPEIYGLYGLFGLYGFFGMRD